LNNIDKSLGRIVDGSNRPITSLRLSINHECNLACFYCHKEGVVKEKRIMTAEEIERLVGVTSKLGIKKVKMTGGELLLRPDVVDIVRRISPLVNEVSLTTNAIKLASLAKPLKAAGLARVNISLHTIRPETYKKICGSGNLTDAISGFEAALAAGLKPIKINMVLLKGINEQELPEMLAFAAEKGAILQIIEFETAKEQLNHKLFVDHHSDLKEIRDTLLTNGKIIGANPLHNRAKFLIDNLPLHFGLEELTKPVEVELVMPMHNSAFCAHCTRIRLTAGGYIKGCLFNKSNVIDVLGPLRAGADDHELIELLMKVIKNRIPYWTEPESESSTYEKDEIGGEVN
jgi:cyclic pyranopterin phosphate synthase